MRSACLHSSLEEIDHETKKRAQKRLRVCTDTAWHAVSSNASGPRREKGRSDAPPSDMLDKAHVSYIWE